MLSAAFKRLVLSAKLNPIPAGRMFLSTGTTTTNSNPTGGVDDDLGKKNNMPSEEEVNEAFEEAAKYVREIHIEYEAKHGVKLKYDKDGRLYICDEEEQVNNNKTA